MLETHFPHPVPFLLGTSPKIPIYRTAVPSFISLPFNKGTFFVALCPADLPGGVRLTFRFLGVSPTAVIEPPMFGILEPGTGG